MDWFSYAAVFFGALSLSLLLVPNMIKLAFRYDVLDHPGHHKTHVNVHPLLGGGAIYVTFMSILLVGMAFLGLVHWGALPGPSGLNQAMLRQIPLAIAALPRLVGLLTGGVIIFFLGLLDDIRGVGFSYKIKFVIQIFAAAILVYSGIRLEFLPHPFLNAVVTILWVVGITNSFNLLDNMDGLSSGVAVIIALILGVLTMQQGQYFSALVLLALTGSILGFLFYNFNPSKIFMGDAGSLFIGYMLAALTISNSYVTTRSASQLPVVVPILVLGVPLFDTFSVMVIRWKERRPIFVGDNCHFSHRLVKMGMSTRQAVIFIYLVTLCVGMSAILIPELHLFGSILVLIQEGLIFGLITLLMMKGNRLHLLHHTLKRDLEELRSVSGDNGKLNVK